MAKIACVLVTHLPVKAELQRQPELRKRPVVVITELKRRSLVLDFSAQAKGIEEGMSTQEVLSICAEAMLLKSDTGYYHSVFEEMIADLLQKSPAVEKGSMGCAFVNIHGLQHMYASEINLIEALLNAVPSEFGPRVGIGHSKFHSYIGAISIGPSQYIEVPEDVPKFLRKKSVSLLPISLTSRDRLKRFGIHTMGQVASLSVSSMQAQFGTEGRLAWELSNGIDQSYLIPITHVETIKESLTFPIPATTLHLVLNALKVLIGKAFNHPSLKRRNVRSVNIEGNMTNRTLWEKQLVFKSPTNDKEKIFFALRTSLETVHLPCPLEDISIILSGITGEHGIQASFIDNVREQTQLRETMRQLEARLRTRPPIYKVVDVEPWSRIPERRQALIDFTP